MLACPNGYISEEGSSFCSICSAGTYETNYNTKCKKCSAGYYSDAGAHTCSECPSGFISEEGSSFCSICPEGTYETNYNIILMLVLIHVQVVLVVIFLKKVQVHVQFVHQGLMIRILIQNARNVKIIMILQLGHISALKKILFLLNAILAIIILPINAKYVQKVIIVKEVFLHIQLVLMEHFQRKVLVFVLNARQEQKVLVIELNVLNALQDIFLLKAHRNAQFVLLEHFRRKVLVFVLNVQQKQKVLVIEVNVLNALQDIFLL